MSVEFVSRALLYASRSSVTGVRCVNDGAACSRELQGSRILRMPWKAVYPRIVCRRCIKAPGWGLVFVHKLGDVATSDGMSRSFRRCSCFLFCITARAHSAKATVINVLVCCISHIVGTLALPCTRVSQRIHDYTASRTTR